MDHPKTDSEDDLEELEEEKGDDLEELEGEQKEDLEEEEGEKENRPHSRTVARMKSEFFRLVPTSMGNQLELLKKLVLDLKVQKMKVTSTAVSGGRPTVYRCRDKVANFLVGCVSNYNIDLKMFLVDWV